MTDLTLNCDRTPSRHRYSQAPPIFAFAADVFSGGCYRFLGEILDLSSEQNLEQFSGRAVSEIENFLSGLERVAHIIANDIELSQPNFPPHLVLCTLSINAFSIDPTGRSDRPPSSPHGCNNSLLS
jgi:hypothetical protein